MKFIKKHKMAINKKLVMFIALIFILLICLLLMKSIFFPGNVSKYGNRLDGIEEVLITNEQVQKLTNEMNEIKDIKSIKYDLKGRLVYIIIEVSNETAIEVSKGYANKILSYFDDNQKEYYDFQVMIKSDSKESEVYPIIGAKHKTSTGFVWTEKSIKKEK